MIPEKRRCKPRFVTMFVCSRCGRSNHDATTGFFFLFYSNKQLPYILFHVNVLVQVYSPYKYQYTRRKRVQASSARISMILTLSREWVFSEWWFEALSSRIPRRTTVQCPVIKNKDKLKINRFHRYNLIYIKVKHTYIKLWYHS